MKSNAEYQAAYRERKKALGVCLQSGCRRRAKVGRVRCARCLKARREGVIA